MSYGLDPDQDQVSECRDLDPYCLLKLSQQLTKVAASNGKI